MAKKQEDLDNSLMEACFDGDLKEAENLFQKVLM